MLLTLCNPEVSKSREEEIALLSVPQALWTLLVVNCCPEFASDPGNGHYLTPIAQYIRGISASIYTQRINAETIYEELRNWTKDCDTGGIFDDEHYTKSTSYHWAVKTCDELSESIASTVRFIQRRMDSKLDKLCRNAHPYEKIGIEYWRQQMKEELFTLEDVKIQTLALRGQVQESVSNSHHRLQFTKQRCTDSVYSATRYVFKNSAYTVLCILD